MKTYIFPATNGKDHWNQEKISLYNDHYLYGVKKLCRPQFV